MTLLVAKNSPLDIGRLEAMQSRAMAQCACDTSPDYIVNVNPDGKVFVQCNRPMIPAHAVELAKLLVKVAEADRGEELLPMGAIR